ncbi:DUF4944 domain-containing protein [Bacillus sp. WMMC1349]|uniref:DUF4944 domain-containing protein n=1 Tax=Bacillus sp. WMMC1349 TaxID=2736254 RepID=UPI00155484A5|nr:DUF4944 domain-containing protein [Bacillus sp. WMMC1349]NPC90758.1 DUF4944 domain-containing protein [Bacillus sp. WMMC1349]NPC91628.1 DUF4944 domain-containing protein [Bacillus sp. WMMC1349]
MEEHYKYPIIFIGSILLVTLVIFGAFKLFDYSRSEDIPEWEGKSKGQNWEVIFKKHDDHSKYSGDLYWIGSKKNIEKTYLKQLVIKIDDEIELDSKIEIPMKDYSGGTTKNGDLNEESVSFLSFTELSQLEGHTITVYLEWRQGNKSCDTQFTLEKKP